MYFIVTLPPNNRNRNDLSMRNAFFRSLVLCSAIVLGLPQISAQQNSNVTRQLVSPSVDFFVPHWQADLQAGGAYGLGGGKFSDLLASA